MTDNETRYFSFDCGRNKKDTEFVIHNWHKGSFNRARPGDYFLYRRPAGISENGQFYFFGAGKVGRIADDPEDEHGGINCLVDDPRPFKTPVYRDDLLNYIKKHAKNGFRGFFSPYGMTTIKPEVFKHILKLGVAVRE